MTTLADSNAAAASAISALTDHTDQQREFLNQTRAAAPELYRRFYVGPTGSDAGSNPGSTSGSPLQTFEEAIRRTPDAGFLEIVLLGSVTMTERMLVNDLSVAIYTTGPTAVPAIEFAGEATNDSLRTAGMHIRGSGLFMLVGAGIVLPSAALAGRGDDGSIILTATGPLAISLHGATVQTATGANTHLLASTGVLDLHAHAWQHSTGTKASVLGAQMPGRWVRGIPSGTALHNGITINSNVANGS